MKLMAKTHTDLSLRISWLFLCTLLVCVEVGLLNIFKIISGWILNPWWSESLLKFWEPEKQRWEFIFWLASSSSSAWANIESHFAYKQATRCKNPTDINKCITVDYDHRVLLHGFCHLPFVLFLRTNQALISYIGVGNARRRTVLLQHGKLEMCPDHGG